MPHPLMPHASLPTPRPPGTLAGGARGALRLPARRRRVCAPRGARHARRPPAGPRHLAAARQTGALTRAMRARSVVGLLVVRGEESASDQSPPVGPWNLSALHPLAPLGRGGIQGPAFSRAPQLRERTRPTHPPVCRFSGAGRLRAHADEAQPGDHASPSAEGSMVARAARLARHTTPPRCAPAL